MIKGEVLLIVSGIKRLKETEEYSFNLPNALNCSLYYWFALVTILITYIPGKFSLLHNSFVKVRRQCTLTWCVKEEKCYKIVTKEQLLFFHYMKNLAYL